MVKRYYTRETSFILGVLLFTFCALTLHSVRAQEIAEENTSTTATSTLAETEIQTSTLPPYTTEPLLGDEVYGDFVVGPGKLEVTVEPGQTKIVEMTVANRTGGSRTFSISYEDATGSSDPTRTIVLLGDDRGPYSMKDYVSVPHQTFVLEHNQRARIPVTITLPQDAEPGGLYGSVLVETVTSEASTGEEPGTAPKSAVVARIGALFFITIPGNVAREGKTEQFGTIGEKKFFQSGPIPFGIMFANTGSIHLAPYGEVRITNIFGEEVGFVELEPWFVLPGAKRLREFSWDRELLFGKYTAIAQIERGYDAPPQTLTFSLWVLPWKPLVGIFAVIFGILFIIRTFFRKFEFKRKE